MLWVCGQCKTRYLPGLPACPHCGGTEYRPDYEVNEEEAVANSNATTAGQFYDEGTDPPGYTDPRDETPPEPEVPAGPAAGKSGSAEPETPETPETPEAPAAPEPAPEPAVEPAPELPGPPAPDLPAPGA